MAIHLNQELKAQFKRHPVLHKAWRVVIALIGGTVVLLGIALLVLPGPAFIVIPAGLGILALEFAWARRWLRKARSMFENNKSH
jgi:uncharacterized protein (TIGR02611 family)